MVATIVGLGIAVVSLLLTLFGLVWKGAAIAGEMKAGLTELRAAVAELKDAIKLTARVPLLEQRVEQLEGVVLGDLSARMRTVWEKLFSLDKHTAITRERLRQISSPDIDPSEPPPPPKR